MVSAYSRILFRTEGLRAVLFQVVADPAIGIMFRYVAQVLNRRLEIILPSRKVPYELPYFPHGTCALFSSSTIGGDQRFVILKPRGQQLRAELARHSLLET